ncbi:hypothetical protein HRR83_006204 [Exophiala dermatitidis]|uniref:RWD domain-containing protein n=2 Tax=Exophiala dermatitidis TaxID=5970 RepID=H6BM27_EXODN|nr:uncharacterized protein HMPREF1120_01164 [Exophiala dermatitidis NIH/UT8656]KAJ4504934.1 hypothetical protein HRR73_008688 [Exophiala dermatitidis]EHY52963.1 hypothetical protein HMPREF1120_01164 [Exophiala dermatitidis NIH/UT8656]KAJ4512231.1 hypothetical protein HRR75_005131 [Exophiala dermatitidis]KAJ4515136.1 hypothetical protein HRR74_005601 [Exophiala dermatitidis]KAJ4548612.1 hypothetical protein HRR76_001203 [Exophiala dermatitidis]
MPSSEAEAEAAERLEAELSLLQAMYPGAMGYDPKSREVHYTSTLTSTSAYTLATTATAPSSSAPTLTLRLPDTYPIKGVPEVIAARDGAKHDIRNRTKRALESGSISAEESGGGEVIDQIIEVFESVAAAASASAVPDGDGDGGREGTRSESKTSTSITDDGLGIDVPVADTTSEIRDPQPDIRPLTKTVIIWLHHLLALSKRKLAVNPTVQTGPPSLSLSSSASGISGLTKPGYPGIMIFSGPRDLVDAHVAQLKRLNWQAFQVRYDSDDDIVKASGAGQNRSGNPDPIPGRNDNDKQKQKHKQKQSLTQNQKQSKRQSGEKETPTRQKDGREEEVAGSRSGSGSEWHFSHGQGKIVEVETMAEVVKAIVDDDKKEIFLRAVGVK